MIYDQAYKVIQELFKYILKIYKIGFEISMKLVSLSLILFIYIIITMSKKKNLNHTGSNGDSPEWIKNKKATLNPANDDDCNISIKL